MNRRSFLRSFLNFLGLTSAGYVVSYMGPMSKLTAGAKVTACGANSGQHQIAFGGCTRCLTNCASSCASTATSLGGTYNGDCSVIFCEDGMPGHKICASPGGTVTH